MKFENYFTLLLSLLLLAFSDSGNCQTAAHATVTSPAPNQNLIKTFHSTSYYEEDGLASNMVHQINQGANGLMWFVTQKGLSSFDGLRWKSVDEAIVPVNSNQVSFLTLQGGDLVFAGIGSNKISLRHFKNKSWEKIPLPSGFPEKVQTHLVHVNTAEHKAGKFHIGIVLKEKLFLYNSITENWQEFSFPEEIDYKRLRGSRFFRNQLYLFFEKQFTSFNLKTLQFDPAPFPELKNKIVLAAAPSSGGDQLFLLGDNFIGKIEEKKYETVVEEIYQTVPQHVVMYNILADTHGRLFFNHNAAHFIYHLKSQKLEEIKLDDPESDAMSTDIFEDSEGNIWFSTLRSVNKVSSFRFHTYNQASGLVADEVSSIFPIDENTLLLGSNNGLSILRNEQLLNLDFRKARYNTSFHRILDATKTPKGAFYLAGNSMGIGKLLPDYSVRWFSPPNEELVASVTYHNDSLFAGTYSGTVYLFDGQGYTPLWSKEGIYIRQIISAGQSLYLLTNWGVYEKQKGGDFKLLPMESLEVRNVYSHLNWKGRTFFGTLEGLAELKNGQVIPVKDPEFQLDRPVYALLQDKEGNLWMGTDKGVYLYNQKKLINYSLKHGLAGKEVNRNAFRLMPDGSIWIGTDQGLSVYNPQYDFTANIIPRIRITHLLAPNEQWFNPLEQTSLPYQDNTIEFFYQPISFYLASEMEYRYRLAGLEDQWFYSRDYWDDAVRYTNLAPGTYTFLVQARYSGTEWSDTAQSAAITILPPFYMRWWFMLLVVGGLCGIGYLTNALVNHQKNERLLKHSIEEKKAELEKSERRFRSIWEATYTGMALIDLKGTLLMANPSLCRILNVRAEDVLRSPILYLLPHSVFRKKNLQKIYDEKEVYQNSLALKLNHKTHHLLVTISVIEQLKTDEPLLIIGCKDVTEQKITEANNVRLNEELVQQNLALLKKEDELANYNHELLQQREELEQALRIVEERNYQLDQFVYKTSHDLRAPIASALGLLNIINMDKDYGKLPEYLHLIHSSLEKQDHFIKAMLNFSRSTRSGNNAEPINFHDFINQCLQELKYLPGFADLKIDLEVIPENSFFYSDRMKLDIVLSNIISNSIKYRDPYKESYLQILISVNETAAEIILKDNGIGIDRKYCGKIFDMFFRASEKSDGSGLGLYIVKQTIDKLHGTIEVESEKGKGSTFKIQIPNQISPQRKKILPAPEDLPEEV